MVRVSNNNIAIIWNADTGSKGKTLSDTGLAAFSPDGKTLAAINLVSTTLTLWNVSAMTAGSPISVAGIASVAFSPDGTKLVTVNYDDRTVKIRNAATGAVITSLATGAVSTEVFSPDGTKILTGSSDGTAKIWDAAAGGAAIRTLTAPDGCAMSSVSFSLNGRKIIALIDYPDNILVANIWDAADTGTTPLRIVRDDTAGQLKNVAFSPATAFAAPSKTGGTIAAGSTDTVNVSPDITGLLPGVHKNTLIMDGGTAGTKNVEITITITAPGAVIQNENKRNLQK